MLLNEDCAAALVICPSIYVTNYLVKLVAFQKLASNWLMFLQELRYHLRRSFCCSSGVSCQIWSDWRMRSQILCKHSAVLTEILKLSLKPYIGILRSLSALAKAVSDNPSSSLPKSRAMGWSRGKSDSVVASVWGVVATTQ